MGKSELPAKKGGQTNQKSIKTCDAAHSGSTNVLAVTCHREVAIVHTKKISGPLAKNKSYRFIIHGRINHHWVIAPEVTIIVIYDPFQYCIVFFFKCLGISRRPLTKHPKETRPSFWWQIWGCGWFPPETETGGAGAGDGFIRSAALEELTPWRAGVGWYGMVDTRVASAINWNAKQQLVGATRHDQITAAHTRVLVTPTCLYFPRWFWFWAVGMLRYHAVHSPPLGKTYKTKETKAKQAKQMGEREKKAKGAEWNERQCNKNQTRII